MVTKAGALVGLNLEGHVINHTCREVCKSLEDGLGGVKPVERARCTVVHNRNGYLDIPVLDPHCITTLCDGVGERDSCNHGFVGGSRSIFAGWSEKLVSRVVRNLSALDDVVVVTSVLALVLSRFNFVRVFNLGLISVLVDSNAALLLDRAGDREHRKNHEWEDKH